MNAQVPAEDLVAKLKGPQPKARQMLVSDDDRRYDPLMIQAAEEIERLQMKLKRHEPTSSYNGLSIEEWMQRAIKAEQLAMRQAQEIRSLNREIEGLEEESEERRK